MEVKPASINRGMAGTDVSVAPAQAQPAPNTANTSETSSGSSVSSEQVAKMTKAVESRLRPTNVSLNFTPYGKNHEKMAVTVSDKNTGEVIREIPSKELQDLYVRMDEVIGTILNKRI